jgi:uncharacterized NAD(P)/FAD-binding protein YdhS
MIRELIAVVCREVRSATGRGIDWRSVIDALRAQTQALWRNLSLPERKRFLRHVRPYWEKHRHRVVPAVAEKIAALQRSGSLSVIAGRIVSIVSGKDGFNVRLR